MKMTGLRAVMTLAAGLSPGVLQADLPVEFVVCDFHEYIPSGSSNHLPPNITHFERSQLRILADARKRTLLLEGTSIVSKSKVREGSSDQGSDWSDIARTELNLFEFNGTYAYSPASIPDNPTETRIDLGHLTWPDTRNHAVLKRNGNIEPRYAFVDSISLVPSNYHPHGMNAVYVSFWTGNRDEESSSMELFFPNCRFQFDALKQ